jgi:PKD repeat protein
MSINFKFSYGVNMWWLNQKIKFWFAGHDRLAGILVWILSSIIIPFNAYSAEPVQLSVAWNYSDSMAGVAGFRLYSADNLLCETNDPSARELTCAVQVQSQFMSFSMTAYDVAGLESAASEPFWVDFGQISVSEDLPPVAYVSTNPVYGLAPLQVHFDGSKSFDPDGRIVSYVWDFSDGDRALVITPSHTFLVPGVYAVSLVVTDDKGNTAKAESMVTVVGVAGNKVGLPPPTAMISAQVMKPDGAGAVRVNFDGSKSADVDGKVKVHRWDFGDGESEEGTSVSHTYGASGSYVVTLVVVDNDGLMAQARKQIVVSSNMQASSVTPDNGVGADTSAAVGGGGCSVRRHGGGGPGGVEWLLSLIFITAVPSLARFRKSTGKSS